jgi:hypothetical protein
MKPVRILYLMLFCLLAAGQAVARQSSPGVYDLGQDGDDRFYSIQCSASLRLILTQTKKQEQICYLNLKQDKKYCLHTTDVRSAARQACDANR